MSAYTVADTPAVRRRIEEDLAVVRRTVRAGDPQLRALVLTGGFARGEGAVRDGQPQNDYDLVAVRGLGRCRPYAEMAAELEQKLGLHIDLAPVWSPRLRVASRSIFWYETALRGRVLWGDPRVLERIPVRTTDGIRPEEGLRLLCNRAAGLLLEKDGTSEAQRIQASKALLGSLDAHLLALGLFPPSQRERWQVYLRAVRAEIPSPADHRLLRWAFMHKTQPDKAGRPPADRVWAAAADGVLAAVPTALRHAGLPSLDAYARRDTWPERVHYWMHAPRGTRRWVMHPSSRVRVTSLRLLGDARGRPRPVRQAKAPEWKMLRQATLQ